MSENKLVPSQATIEVSDEAESRAFLQAELEKADEKLSQFPSDGDVLEKAALQLNKASALLGLEQNEAAWNEARAAFDSYVEKCDWAGAVEACDVLYQTDQPGSIIALAHGVWLSITYPIDAEHSIVMLSYVVDETPADSDGGAVAAATAHYVVGLRADDDKIDSLSFLTTNLIAKVAQRHGNVDSQEKLDFWIEKMELSDPKIFLPRMGKVLDVIVGNEASWWFNREELRQQLPLN